MTVQRFLVGRSDEILKLEAGDGIVFERLGDVLRIHSTLLHTPKSTYKTDGVHLSAPFTFISGAGVAGVDNTAQVVLQHVVPANTLTQLGDRMRVRSYWTGDTGSPITGTSSLGPAGAPVPISHTTDGGAATLQLNEAWLHYLDATHANIIEDEAGGLGILSAPNVSGFDWAHDQVVQIAQDKIANNHIVVYALICDIFPKGAIA
jgi:hypothetical protein